MSRLSSDCLLAICWYFQNGGLSPSADVTVPFDRLPDLVTEDGRHCHSNRECRAFGCIVSFVLETKPTYREAAHMLYMARPLTSNGLMGYGWWVRWAS